MGEGTSKVLSNRIDSRSLEAAALALYPMRERPATSQAARDETSPNDDSRTATLSRPLPLPLRPSRGERVGVRWVHTPHSAIRVSSGWIRSLGRSFSRYLDCAPNTSS